MTITVTELAAELRMDEAGIHARIRRLGLPTYKRIVNARRHCTLTDQDAQALRASIGPTIHVTEAGEWFSTEQAAALLRLKKDTFQKRIERGLITPMPRRARLVGPGVIGWHYLYHPGDLQALAARQPIRPAVRPRGTLTAPALAQAAQCGHSTVQAWKRDGCPHHLTTSGEVYWVPAEVIAWLEATFPHGALGWVQVYRRAHIRNLRAHLAGQQGRAA